MPKHMSIEDRFLEKVSPEPMSGCWLWVGGCAGTPSHPDPRMTVNYVSQSAAHISVALAGKPIPDGMQANHHCDNRLCVNPNNIYPGTQFENIHDCLGRGRGNRSHGESHFNARLTERQVAEVRRRYVPRRVTQQQLADEIGVHRVTIGEALRGVTWKKSNGVSP